MDENRQLTTTPVSLQMAPIEKMKGWYNDFVTFTKDLLKPDLDFGEIPGVSKKTLLKPGAEKLRLVYGLSVVNDQTDKTIDLSSGLIDYTYKCKVMDGTGRIIADCEGSCNSYEEKFRYRWVKEDELPANVNKDSLKKKSSTISEFSFAIDKAETNGTYGKPKEYWDKWKAAIASGAAKRIKRKISTGREMDAYEMGGSTYRIENPDIMGLKNTIQKMAQKRAFVGAMIMATGASEFFTQDLEDMDLFDITDDPVSTLKQVKTVDTIEDAQVVETVSEVKKTEEKPKPPVKTTSTKKVDVEKKSTTIDHIDVVLPEEADVADPDWITKGDDTPSSQEVKDAEEVFQTKATPATKADLEVKQNASDNSVKMITPGQRTLLMQKIRANTITLDSSELEGMTYSRARELIGGGK